METVTIVGPKCRNCRKKKQRFPQYTFKISLTITSYEHMNNILWYAIILCLTFDPKSYKTLVPLNTVCRLELHLHTAILRLDLGFLLIFFFSEEPSFIQADFTRWKKPSTIIYLFIADSVISKWKLAFFDRKLNSICQIYFPRPKPLILIH